MTMFEFDCAMIYVVCLSSTGRTVYSVYICLYVKISQFIYKISLQLVKYVIDRNEENDTIILKLDKLTVGSNMRR
jgi:hypothetical protein